MHRGQSPNKRGSWNKMVTMLTSLWYYWTVKFHTIEALPRFFCLFFCLFCFVFVTRSPFWPSGIVGVSVCNNHVLVRAITQNPIILGSPNLDRRCKRLRFLFLGFLFFIIFCIFVWFLGLVVVGGSTMTILKSKSTHFELVRIHDMKLFPVCG